MSAAFRVLEENAVLPKDRRSIAMVDKVKEISMWLLEQGVGIAQDVLEEKVQEAYEQGRIDSYHEQVESTLENILHNTMQGIEAKKLKLYKKDFYVVPSVEDVAQMHAYEYLTENLPQIIKDYSES
jgi:hypothetical protein